MIAATVPAANLLEVHLEIEVEHFAVHADGERIARGFRAGSYVSFGGLKVYLTRGLSSNNERNALDDGGAELRFNPHPVILDRMTTQRYMHLSVATIDNTIRLLEAPHPTTTTTAPRSRGAA